jgi:HlyD family secretion protein
VKQKFIFVLALVGVIAGLIAAYVYGLTEPPQPPVFTPSSNPYPSGIFANGIVESYQTSGENVAIYPEVSGPVTHVMVHEGEHVSAGTPLIRIDDSVQQASTAQLHAQAEAAYALLDELRAQPRQETLAVTRSQLDAAQANLRLMQDQYDKQQRSYGIDPRSVSRDVLDNAADNLSIARANREVSQRQYDLTRAGAWVYDVRNQQKQVDALERAATAADALLAKYTVRAPVDGIVLSVYASSGTYASPQGVYDPYTQGQNPALVMGSPSNWLAVRCYVDEILITRLPDLQHMRARMFIRGTKTEVPLEFVRIQPYVSPKIELSAQRQERVDVRVLPVIFRFAPPAGVSLYPGQLVDVYIAGK